MTIVSFSKYSGCGNDFIIVDNRSRKVTPWISREAISKLCHRQRGIGADGVILLEHSDKADFRMRIFNSDGSEAEMCGNGIRCLARFIFEQSLAGHQFVIETMQHLIPICIQEENISVQIPSTGKVSTIILEINTKQIEIHHLDTGVPHAIVFVEDIDNDQHLLLAPSIRFHPHFHPKGTNVNFVQINPRNNSIDLRTYERGVESETMACGTGAVAAALITAQVHLLTSPIAVQTRSKDILHVAFNKRGRTFEDVTLTGPANNTFHGEIDLMRLLA